MTKNNVEDILNSLQTCDKFPSKLSDGERLSVSVFSSSQRGKTVEVEVISNQRLEAELPINNSRRVTQQVVNSISCPFRPVESEE